MGKYIRFQSALRCESTARPLGIFAAAGRLEDSPHMDANARPWLRDALAWFNHNLKVPALEGRRWRSIFWFRSEAQQFVARVWDVVAVLREEGLPIQMQRTSNPGQIVYSDEFQIAAIPPRWRRHNQASRRTPALRV